MKKKNNKQIIKKLGSNFILWILIIVMSVSILQYATFNSQSTSISFSEFDSMYKNQYDNMSYFI